MNSIEIRSIGVIHSVFSDPANMARQARVDGKPGTLELDPAYLEGLVGLEDFSHIIALYHFHKETEVKMKVPACFDPDGLHGIFTCRVPPRPNHIGISVLSIARIEENLIHCHDVDVLNGTPLLDIKPYVRQFDMVPSPRSGWYDNLDWMLMKRRVWDSHDMVETHPSLQS